MTPGLWRVLGLVAGSSLLLIVGCVRLWGPAGLPLGGSLVGAGLVLLGIAVAESRRDK